MTEMKQLVYHYFVNIPESKIAQAEAMRSNVPQQVNATREFFMSRLAPDFTQPEQAPLMVDVLVEFLV